MARNTGPRSTSTSGKEKGSRDAAPGKAKSVILGIDFGSSEFRVLLLDPEHPKEPWSSDELVLDSTCSPLDPQFLSKFGEQVGGKPNNLSAKYLMYLLSDKSNEALKVYPLPDKILRNHGQNKNTFRKILVNFLAQVKEEVDEYVPKVVSHTYNQNIVLTIPGHWQEDNALKAYYVSIVTEVFGDGNQSDNIRTIPDTEALAKYVRFYRPELVNDLEKVLFLDFGAHCLSWSLFTFEILPGGGRNVVVDGTNGVAGGIEMCTHHAGKEIAAKLQEQGTPDPFQVYLCSMMKHFRDQKYEALQSFQRSDERAEESIFPLEIRGGPKDEQANVYMSAEEVKRCFVEGMKAPIEMARKKLEELREMERDNSKVGVIITGECMKSEYVRDALFRHGDQSYGPPPGINLARVTYMADVIQKGPNEIPVRLWNCYGALLSMKIPSNVQKFIDDGAAWAFQALKKTKKKNEKEGHWEWDTKDNPVSLWKGIPLKLHWWVKISAWVNDKEPATTIKIICDPNFSQRVAAQPRFNPPKINQIDKCYDFHTISELKQKMIWVRIVPVMEPGCLVFRIEWAHGGVDHADEHVYVDCDEQLRVYFDTSDNRVKARPADMIGTVEYEEPEEEPEEQPEEPQNTAPRAEEEGAGGLNIYRESPPRSSQRSTARFGQKADEEEEEEENTDEKFYDASEELPPPGADQMSTPPAPPPPRPPSNSQQGHKRNTCADSEVPSPGGSAPPKRPRAGTGTSAPTQSRAPATSTGQTQGGVNTPQSSPSLNQRVIGATTGPRRGENSTPETGPSPASHPRPSSSRLSQPSSAGQPRGNLNTPQSNSRLHRPVIEEITRPQRGENTTPQSSSSLSRPGTRPFTRSQRGENTTLETGPSSEPRPRTSSAGPSGQGGTSQASSSTSGQARENPPPGNRFPPSLQRNLPLRPSPSPAPSPGNPSPDQSTASQDSSARPELPNDAPSRSGAAPKPQGKAKRGGRKGR